ncbi:MAG: 3-hydroxyacyl-CoA dehydrogenase family protein, partial [Candidatus Eremiobacteraeota bacterium]|nr:3-hydroxyacyl-CoA dehydrogenase family protein [Candidatus Eremiobacteraeota bacterium]
LATSESIYTRTEAQRLEPSPLQREMVEAGTLGRKSGRGFYAYPQERGPARTDDAAAVDDADLNEDERVVVLGFGSLGPEFSELLGQHFAHVETIENDEFVGEIGMDATIAIDTGDGVSDRADVIRELDTLLPPETVIFVDAYATDMHALCKRLAHPERVVGYGILGTLAGQRVVEIVDSESTGDDALELAQEVFAALGKGVALVEESPALYVGRTVGSIVNEAMYAVQEGVANADDIDTAMRLGTNYPIGPIAWGREVGGRRISRILQRLADAEGAAFAPHRALWVLDAVEEAPEAEPVADA